MSESIDIKTIDKQDNSTELESILEQISLECVLADIADPESFSELLALLKTFFQKAKDCNFPELAEDAKKAGKIVKTIMEQKSPDDVPDNENLMDSVNLIISEMKSFLHFITRSSELAESVNLSEAPEITGSAEVTEGSVHIPIAPPPAPSPMERGNEYYNSFPLGKAGEWQNNYLETYSEIKEEIKPEAAPEVKSKEINLIHPGQLPAFLNIEDFAEFLSLQKNTLEKMEVLILDIEKENNRDYAQGELKRIFHTTKGEAGFLGLKDVQTVCHRAEDLMDTGNFGNIVDTLLAVKDWLEATYNVYTGNPGTAPLIDKLIALFDDDKTQLYGNKEQTDVDKKQNLSVLNSTDNLTKSNLDRNPAQPEHEENLSPANSASPLLIESINVDAIRLDRMVNIIGELAIAESMVTQSPEIKNIATSTLLRALNSLHKITRELQTLGLSLRMVPLKSLFNRMDRVVRDLAKKTGKKIQFIIKGESAELDKTLVDKLGDPLIHLVRNSVDHGIEESIREREEAGKPETATIEMRAFQKGGYLFIEVEDDGRGVNRKRLAEKAISQGIIKSVSQQSISTYIKATPQQDIITVENLDYIDKIPGDEILNLVFHPGLTTASKVTDVSGRGVGMDVVKKSIESCRGKVSIASTEGKGTTCTIKIPLTLSIIDGLVVRVEKEVYVIPTLSVVTSLKVNKTQISNVFERGEMINVMGKLIPLFRLSRLFKLKPAAKEGFSVTQGELCALQDTFYNGIVVVVEDNGLHTALLVDELVGKQNTVIKNLGMGSGMGIDEIKGISGGTIMPDGKVSLILDIAGIIELSHTY